MPPSLCDLYECDRNYSGTKSGYMCAKGEQQGKGESSKNLDVCAVCRCGQKIFYYQICIEIHWELKQQNHDDACVCISLSSVSLSTQQEETKKTMANDDICLDNVMLLLLLRVACSQSASQSKGSARFGYLPLFSCSFSKIY